MTFHDVRLLIGKSVNAWVDDYAPSMGAAIAYYTLFSMAPLLILLIGLAGLVFGQDAAQGEIVLQLQGRIGPVAAVAVQDLVKSVSHPARGAITTAFGVITLLLGASSVFGELQSALNRIWRAPDPARRSTLFHLVRTRLRSFAMVLGLGLLLLLSLVFSAMLSAVGAWSDHLFSGWQSFLQFANFVVSFAANAFVFALMYKLMPRARVAWRDVGIGATVTALLFEISKLFIGVYIGRTSAASGFGAAGSLVVFLLWVYLSAQIFLLGAEFTWVYAHQHGSRAERFETKAAPLVPTRAGDATAAAKKEMVLRPSTPASPTPKAESYPYTKKYASAAGRLMVRKPLVGVGVLAALGVVLAAFSRGPIGPRPSRRPEPRPPDRAPDV